MTTKIPSSLRSCCLVLPFALTQTFSAQATPDLRIYDGEPAKTCEWPSTVHFVGVCSGTLVHPRVVLYAAHCGARFKELMFGENKAKAHGKTVKVKYCHKNPKFKDFAQGEDYAYCLLEEPVTDVPIAPIAYGCELEQVKAGADIWLVGFGTIKDQSAGTKHKGKSKIRKLVANDSEIVVGGDNVATTCYGDSGGPAFIQLSDGSWRTIGIVSYGTNKSCEYPSGLTLPNVAVPWIHQDLKKNGVDDIDLLPCYDEDGTWNPSDACTRFPLDHGHSTANWDSMCSEGAKLSGPSTICAPEDKEPPTLAWSKIKDGDIFEKGQDIEVSVDASDNSKIKPSLTLWVNDEKQETLEAPPYRWILKDHDAGELKLRALAVDTAKNEADIEATVTVKGKEEEPKDESSTDSGEGEGETESDSQDDTGEDQGDTEDNANDDSAGEEDDEQDEEQVGENKGQTEKGTSNKKGSGCAINAQPNAPWLLFCIGGWGLSALRRRKKR